MSKETGDDAARTADFGWVPPSEPESHTEHLAALDATVFRTARDQYELVLELEAGELRVRRPRRP